MRPDPSFDRTVDGMARRRAASDFARPEALPLTLAPLHCPAESALSRRTRWEMAAVLATGALHPLFFHVLHLEGVFIALVLGCWLTYLAARVRAHPPILAQWGFSTAHLERSFAATAVVAACVIGVLAWLASRSGSLPVHWHMLPLLLLYPLWGLFQQLMVQGILVRPLALGVAPVLSRGTAVGVAAVLFGAVHLPDTPLAAATAVMGLVFTPLYLRWGNLWPLGLFHGWLGVAFYFWYLGRDPWSEVFRGWA